MGSNGVRLKLCSVFVRALKTKRLSNCHKKKLDIIPVFLARFYSSGKPPLPTTSPGEALVSSKAGMSKASIAIFGYTTALLAILLLPDSTASFLFSPFLSFFLPVVFIFLFFLLYVLDSFFLWYLYPYFILSLYPFPFFFCPFLYLAILSLYLPFLFTPISPSFFLPFQVCVAAVTN